MFGDQRLDAPLGAVDGKVKRKTTRNTAANSEKMVGIEGGLPFFKITPKCNMRS